MFRFAATEHAVNGGVSRAGNLWFRCRSCFCRSYEKDVLFPEIKTCAEFYDKSHLSVCSQSSDDDESIIIVW